MCRISNTHTPLESNSPLQYETSEWEASLHHRAVQNGDRGMQLYTNGAYIPAMEYFRASLIALMELSQQANINREDQEAQMHLSLRIRYSVEEERPNFIPHNRDSTMDEGALLQLEILYHMAMICGKCGEYDQSIRLFRLALSQISTFESAEFIAAAKEGILDNIKRLFVHKSKLKLAGLLTDSDEVMLSTWY